MHIKEIDNIVPNNYLNVIDSIVGRNFPWFTDPVEKTTDHHYPSFYHIVLRRPEEGDRINSDLYTPLKNMFEEIAKKHNIKYKEFGRIGVNCTFHEKEKWGNFHVDHAYPNKSLLIFLNNFDEGSFFITSKKYNKKLGTDIGAKKPTCNITEIKSKKNKGVFFDGSYYHSRGFPKDKQKRIVIVYTFW